MEGIVWVIGHLRMYDAMRMDLRFLPQKNVPVLVAHL
jgi:hypothetical protein